MIRRVRQSDVEKIEKILKKIPQFTVIEIEIAMELVNIAVNNKTQTDYNVFVFEQYENVLGYHCTGKRPLTDAVYDMYWIVADPESQIKGVGTKLVEHAELFVTEKGARWLLAETSSRESYTRTRNFYLRNNFSIVAEINDFYSAGDNLIVFGKYFK
ncbi:MAG: GNAT family N-acetyltransferase [Ignavibacteria bacterium GWA2_35_9]|nr:MAG: GNAT family N-acetyltransferase [Ignavibacteria bacterium GWA2_35_9]OGU48141.1 MAG: GNAT family N-acetyltransferase [Ignavibacteria bacterium GWC2_36_12]OGV17892.1 MAG: GNAT family N-acetyltransferase [Ignavibacteria bacterium RIFOXYA2_FULL_37_17]